MKRTVIAITVVTLAALSLSALAQRAKEAETLFHQGVHFEEVRGELKEAIEIFEKIVKGYPENRPIAAKAYYHLGVCYEKLGRAQAADAFKAIVEKYPDQMETVRLARKKLSLLAKPEPPAEKVSEELKINLVWQDESMDSTGEISPDGRNLSFVDWTTSDLAVRDMATGEVRRLTSKKDSPPGSYEASDCSIWSPDSREIAYNWYGNDPDFCELRIISLDGSEPRVLYRGDYFKDWVHPCDWSSDGQYILTKFLNTGSLGLVSVKDGSVRLLDNVKVAHLDMVKLSPDSRYIVIEYPQKSDAAKRDLSIIPVEGNDENTLVEHPSDDRLLGWAPDGKSLLFLSDRTGAWDVWMIRISEGKLKGAPHMVRRGIGLVKPMGMTQAGSLYYSTPGFEWDIFSTTLDPDTGQIIDPPRKLPLLHEGHNFSPRLSPDGKHLFYRSKRGPGRSGQYVPCVYSFDSGTSREIRPKDSFSGFSISAWMPDGPSIVLRGSLIDKKKGFFKMNLESGDTMILLSEEDFAAKDENGFPEISNFQIFPDGQSFLYSYQGPGNVLRVMTRRRDSNEETEICRFPIRDPRDINGFLLAPDGSRLALIQREDEDVRAIKVLPLSGGDIKEIHRFHQEGRWLISMAWSPDGRYIYFPRQSDPTDDGKWQLWRVPSGGGNAQNLGLTANKFPFLCPHPDGKRIIFCSRTADEQGGAAIWVMKNFMPAAEPKDIIVRRIFQDTGTGIVGSPSPDGRFLSDIDRKTGNLVIRDLASGSVRSVTNAPGLWDEYALYSVFSADGEKLAYTWFNKEGNFEIRTIGLDGTGVKTVFGGINAVDVGPLGWSSDGRNILAFIYRIGGISEIVLISTAEASSRVIRQLEGMRLGTARLSPDGRFIAYDRAVEKPVRSSDIFLIPVNGGEDIPLVRHEAMDRLLGWTPDGQGILFASDRAGSNDAWLIRVADGHSVGDPALVKKGLSQILPMGFDRSGAFFYGIQAQVFDVYIASVDIESGKMLSPPTPVAKRYVGSNDSPGWSPDGKTLAYVLRSAAASRSLLCLRSMESGDERDLALEMYVRWPQWSPDGRKILVWGRKDPADYGYYFVDRAGTVMPFVLNTETHSVYRAVWSPDGKAVYFIRSTNDPKGESRLIRRDIDTGRETEILRGTLITGIAVSPDGRNIAFRSYDDPDVTLMMMPASGGDIQELVRVKKPEVISMANVPFWTPDGRYLLYPVTRLHPQGGTTTKMWRLDLRTREAKPLDLTMSPMLTLAIHPDGKRIAFESGEPKVEIWVMENFLDKN